MQFRPVLLLLLLSLARQQQTQGTQQQQLVHQWRGHTSLPCFAAAVASSATPPPLREEQLLEDIAAETAGGADAGDREPLFFAAAPAPSPSQLPEATLGKLREHVTRRDGLLAAAPAAPPDVQREAGVWEETAAGDTAGGATTALTSTEEEPAGAAARRPRNISSTAAASGERQQIHQEEHREPLRSGVSVLLLQQQQPLQDVPVQQQQLFSKGEEQRGMQDPPFTSRRPTASSDVFRATGPPSSLASSFPSAVGKSPAESAAATEGHSTVERPLLTVSASDETSEAADGRARNVSSRSNSTGSSSCGDSSCTPRSESRKREIQSGKYHNSGGRSNRDNSGTGVLHSHVKPNRGRSSIAGASSIAGTPTKHSRSAAHSRSEDNDTRTQSPHHHERNQQERSTAHRSNSGDEPRTTRQKTMKGRGGRSEHSGKGNACSDDERSSDGSRKEAREGEGTTPSAHQRSSADYRSSTSGTTSDRTSNSETRRWCSLSSCRSDQGKLPGSGSSGSNALADGGSRERRSSGKEANSKNSDGGGYGAEKSRNGNNTLLDSIEMENGKRSSHRRRTRSSSSSSGTEDVHSTRILHDSFTSMPLAWRLLQSENSSGSTDYQKDNCRTESETAVATVGSASAPETLSRGEVAEGLLQNNETLQQEAAAEQSKVGRAALSAPHVPREPPNSALSSGKADSTIRQLRAVVPLAAAASSTSSNKTDARASPSTNESAAPALAVHAAMTGRNGVAVADNKGTAAAASAHPISPARAASSARLPSLSSSPHASPSSLRGSSSATIPPSSRTSPHSLAPPDATSSPPAHPATDNTRSSSHSSSAAPSSSSSSKQAFPEDDSSTTAAWWVQWRRVWLISVSVCIVLLAGTASGLTTGLMAFDELQLLVVQQTGAGKEKQQAEAVCDLVHRNRHQLLVTLLLCNALAMEALPLFLDRLVSPVLAVLLSVTAILFVGEILPQALCTGRYQLAIAATLAPFVRLLLIIFWPAAYPISRLLDCWLSDKEKPSLYARAHLKALIGLHQRDRQLPLLLQHRMETRRAQAQASRRSASRKTRKGGEQEFLRVGSGTPRVAATGGDGAADGGCRTTPAGAEAPGIATAAGAAAGSAEADAAGARHSGGLPQMGGSTEKSNGAPGDAGRGLERWREAAGSGEQDTPGAAASRAVARLTQETAYSRSGIDASAEDLEHAVGLHRDEVLIMQGALDMACKSVCDLMVSLKDVFMLEASVRLTRDVLIDILAKGHSRIPVYEKRRENVRGVLLVKSLVLIDPGAGVRVADLMRGRSFRRLCTPLFVAPNINPYKLLNEFQEGRCHLAFVTRDVAAYQQAWEENTSVPVGTQLLGIVTLEDVIEELIQEEIMDEFDRRFRANGSSSSIRGVDGHPSMNLCLRAANVSSSEAAGGDRPPEELCKLLEQPARQSSSPARELRQPAEAAQTEENESGSSGTGVLASSRRDSEALSRFASLLLTGSQEAPLRGEGRDAIDQGRSATSILASSQLGSRASLLFASAPDVEGGRPLDVVWGEPGGSSRGVRHVARRLQQQEMRGRCRRRTAYFPISKDFTAGYPPALQLKKSSTGRPALADIPPPATGVPPGLLERLLSASPPAAASNHRRLLRTSVSATAAGANVGATAGRSNSGT